MLNNRLQKQNLKHLQYITIAIYCIVIAYFMSDLYLPAMPAIKIFFKTTISAIQYTVSIYLVGLAISQFFVGPIIDHYGYRKILISTTSLFIISTIFCALSNSLQLFYVMRFIQSLAAGALIIIGRASIPKLFNQQQTTRLYFVISPISALTPAIAPVIGGYLTHYCSWNSVFYFCSVLGIILLLLILKYYPVTEIFDTSRFSFKLMLKNYFSILKNRNYVGFVIIICSIFSAWFLFLSESPFIYHAMNYKAKDIGLFYIYPSLGFLVFSQLCRILIKLIPLPQLINLGFLIIILGSILLFLTPNIFLVHSAFVLILPVTIICCGNGILCPISIGHGISCFPDKPGYATSFLTSSSLLMSGISASVANKICHGSITLLATYILALIFIGWIGFLITTR